jgi:two-component system, cell cycle sensor histidine kinase and response regulator CckA
MVILLVDDDVDLRNLLRNSLNAHGYTVLTAADGDSALEASRNHSGVIDLLLSDVEMPCMNGWQLCKIIAVERPGTKILMMSGTAASQVEDHSLRGLPFLQKPFTPTALRNSILSLLGPIPPLR